MAVVEAMGEERTAYWKFPANANRELSNVGACAEAGVFYQLKG